jgi:chromosome segregation protein
MRIRELQLYGFKSFPHKTSIRFGTGISAIIGPNGCGKSNVLDALRWVLGEQSFSILRCTRNEDVVFGGTAKVPALGYAEVRLILENEQNLPGFGSEIEVRRRYFRSGESEYFLNRNLCRLKDIQDLFFNTGTGTKAYSIFDLRSLRAIIAGELRPMFEEAATLAKYRERKTDCLRKLELTDADLQRLNDIVTERERITRSLRRQAYRLSAHTRLREEEKRLRLLAMKVTYDVAKADAEKAATELSRSEQGDAELLAQIEQQEKALAVLRAELSSGRQQRETLLHEIEEQRQKLSQAETQRRLHQSEIEHAEHELAGLKAEAERRTKEIAGRQEALATREQARHELTAQQQVLETELVKARSSTQEQEARLLELRRQLALARETGRRLTDEQVTRQRAILGQEAQAANLKDLEVRLSADVAILEPQLAEANTSLAARQQELAAVTARLDALRLDSTARRTRHTELRAQLEALEREEQRLGQEYLNLSQELATCQPALDRPAQDAARVRLGEALLGNAADFLKVSEGYEAAVEVALYGMIDALVVNEQVVSGLSALDRNARWEFLIADCGARNEECDGQVAADSLQQHVEFRPGAPEQLRAALARVRLAADLNQAWQMARLGPTRPDAVVTRDGIGLFRNGLIVLESEGQGRLVLARRVQELKARVSDTKSRLDHVREDAGARRDESRQLAAELETRDQDLVGVIAEHSRIDAEASGLDRARARLSDDMGRLRREAGEAKAKLAELTAALATAARELGEQEARIRQSEAAAADLDAQIGRLEQDVKAGLDAAAQVLLRLTQIREQVNSRTLEIDLYRAELEQVTTRQAESEARCDALTQDMAGRRQQVELLATEIAGAGLELQQGNARLAALDLSSGTAQEDELNRRLHEQRVRQEAARQQTLELRLRSLEAQHRRQELEREAELSFGASLSQFQAEPEPDAENKLRLITARLERLGRVNPLAGEDYKREQEELTRLTTQRADVLAAKDNLLKTVAEIDRFAQEQFTATFSAVRESFRTIFGRLFVDGEADLVLESPANPLESPINIIAKPKGKSPKRLDQLSDGEKALLALSLLFAFYQYKPAPFCFLDEVDAPLDDANVDRFAQYLKELSAHTQIMIITHNRATVEQADVLFGVTTEEPGVSKIVSVKLADLTTSKGKLLIPPAQPV